MSWDPSGFLLQGCSCPPGSTPSTPERSSAGHLLSLQLPGILTTGVNSVGAGQCPMLAIPAAGPPGEPQFPCYRM